MPESKSLVAVIMGSKSDWETMRHAVETLDELGVPNEAHVLSAHRTPDATAEFARNAAARDCASSSPAQWCGTFSWSDCRAYLAPSFRSANSNEDPRSSIHCCRLHTCLVGFRWVRWLSAKRAPKTLRFLPALFWQVLTTRFKKN